uniref:Uncharacterized protein n=1 Tax=Amphimedon queenslandica TaxID=400682 RepID=A0A1X7SGK6_AMPQE
MIQAISPRYQVPHKDYFSRVAIPSLYDEVSATREPLQLAFTSFLCAWVKDHKGGFKKKQGENKMEVKIQLQTPCGFVV